MDSLSPRIPIGSFLPPIIIPPLEPPHQNTIIFLHGRGSNARKFHRPLLDILMDNGQTFQETLATTRFVFPTAPMSRATKYARMLIHQWFDGSGDWEPDARGGMRPSIEYIQNLLRSEIQLVDGDSGRVALAGLSQGCATALTSLLLWDGQSLGALVGLCGYMPICSHLIHSFDDNFPSEEDVFEREEVDSAKSPLQRALEELHEEAEMDGVVNCSSAEFLSTPIFLGHGTVDPQVGVSQAVLADKLLRKMGVKVELHIYDGLGHWYSPEMLSQVVAFLQKHFNQRTR